MAFPLVSAGLDDARSAEWAIRSCNNVESLMGGKFGTKQGMTMRSVAIILRSLLDAVGV